MLLHFMFSTPSCGSTHALTHPYECVQDFHHVMGFGMKTIHDAEHIFEDAPGRHRAAARSEDDER
jgi:hypothetical protein